MNILNTLLSARGISQSELARAIQVSQTTISDGLKRPTHWQLEAFLALVCAADRDEWVDLLASCAREVLGDESESLQDLESVDEED